MAPIWRQGVRGDISSAWNMAQPEGALRRGASTATSPESGMGAGRGSEAIILELESFLPGHLDGSLGVGQGPLGRGAAQELVSGPRVGGQGAPGMGSVLGSIGPLSPRKGRRRASGALNWAEGKGSITE